MTLVTLKPNGSDSTASVTGAASAHAALADGSDSSYVAFDADESILVDLETFTIPAGSYIRKGAVTARTAKVAASVSMNTFLVLGGVATDNAYPTIGWGSPTSHQVLEHSSAITSQTTIDGAQIAVSVSAAMRLYELGFALTYIAAPAPSVTAPIGLVTDTNTPVVTWDPGLDPDGGPQALAEIRIVNDDDTFFDGGSVTGTGTTWAGSVALPDGYYTAHVKVAQIVDGTPVWAEASAAFSIDVALPNEPIFGPVTPEPTQGHISIVLGATPGLTTTDEFELERSDDAGVTWAPVRTKLGASRVAFDDAYGITDHEAPIGIELLYRARSLHNYSGLYARSAWAFSPPVMLTTGWWLTHATRPAALRLAINPHAFPSVRRAARQGTHQPLGARLPIVISDTRTAWSGEISLRCDSIEDREALDELLDVQEPLLLRGPRSHSWPETYVVFGDQARARAFDKAWVAESFEALPFVTVAAPAGPVEAW